LYAKYKKYPAGGEIGAKRNTCKIIRLIDGYLIKHPKLIGG
jgi:hypothetical protein